jgi:aspartyl-tRNA(Asn)/glutamyl-tRNA(Gln) amidotransferase subunit B
MNLEPVIGLEIHVQLKTQSKMFCACDNAGEDRPINTTVCEICMGHPGTLPAANRTAIEWAIKTAHALSCAISPESKFDRKHYFYPDLPKGYQISQYDQPLGRNGFMLVKTDRVDESSPRKGFSHIRIHRLHLEEDAAKLVHALHGGSSMVDFNRAGTPLMEIVTEPDIRASAEAGTFLKELRMLMRALRVSDADMEKGHLRADANISLRPIGESALYPKTEIKNLNSFRSVERALDFEISRQSALWAQGSPPKTQSTRGWNQDLSQTVPHRSKESAHDYRYFQEPDIAPLKIRVDTETGAEGVHLLTNNETAISLASLTSEMPELPQAKRFRFIEEYGLEYENAALLTSDIFLSEFFEKTISELKAWLIAEKPISLNEKKLWDEHHAEFIRLSSSMLINKLGALVHAGDGRWESVKITPENFAELVTLIFEKKISSSGATAILEEMSRTGADPCAIRDQKGLAQVDDSTALKQSVSSVLVKNPDIVDSYKKGNTNVVQFLVGEVMKETKGQANPQIVRNLFTESLEK